MKFDVGTIAWLSDEERSICQKLVTTCIDHLKMSVMKFFPDLLVEMYGETVP